MSAPQIPNLLSSLRGARSARGGRARRNDGAPSGADADRIVQETDSDAAGSRLSAVAAGYLDDAFARSVAASSDTPRRMPIINRGTYVRTTALDTLVEQFLDEHAGQRTQIVSLGAGTDTRFFRLLARRAELSATLHYIELDFAATTARKVQAVTQMPALKTALAAALAARADATGKANVEQPSIAADHTALTSSVYSVQAVDLRQLGSADTQARLALSPCTPTLLLSECCLTYLPAVHSASLLQTLAGTLIPAPTHLEILLYEPLHPHDAFGRTMVANLAARGIEMPGLDACPTLDAHKMRLRDAGFVDVLQAWEIRQIWDTWVGEREKERLRGLEMVDEEEEWMLLAGHYGIIRGARKALHASSAS